MKYIKKFKLLILIAVLLIAGYMFVGKKVQLEVAQDEVVRLDSIGDYYQKIKGFTNAKEGIEPVDAFKSTCDFTKEGYQLAAGCKVSFVVDSKETANYELRLDYIPNDVVFKTTSLAMRVNGELPYSEASDMLIQREFSYIDSTFATDRMGNEFVGAQKVDVKKMSRSPIFRQAVGTSAVLVPLKAGSNEIEFEINQGSLVLNQVTFDKVTTLVPYGKYANEHADYEVHKLITLEAEALTSKSASEINVNSSNTPAFSPFDVNVRLINGINSESFKTNGSTVSYEVDIEENGFYPISLRYTNPKKEKSTVFLDVLVNGQIPFAEYESYPIGYASSTANITLPYNVYLEKGKQTISFRINSLPYQVLDERVTVLRGKLNDIKINLIKLTGNNFDSNREWNISSFLPSLKKDLIAIQKEVDEITETLRTFNGGKQTFEVLQLGLASTNLTILMEDTNRIVANYSVLEALIGNLTQSQTLMSSQPISLDRVFLGKGDGLPSADVSLLDSMSIELSRLVNSFGGSRNPDGEGKEINIWVRRPQQYVDQMQKYIDTTFTKQSGIKVNLSVTTDQSKVTLAVASNTAPDGIMGVDSWYVSDLALRGAIRDLRSFPDANSLIKEFTPGALLQMTSDDKLFGFPEVQDLYMLFYRTDILKSLELEVPSTWDDVIAMLPTLQRYGMNFYTPLSGPESNKSWPGMAPFIMQNNARIFAPDGMSVELDSQESVNAMQQMTDLFTIYSMPLQIGEFYNSFRDGTIPIGISNVSSYIKLLSAAPEIANSWEIAMIPGITQADGTIARWSTGGSTAIAMIEKSTKHDETWEFYKWWMSEEVQTQYMMDMQMTYGDAYLWNSGNVKAFGNMNIREKDLAVMKQQMNWVQEVPRIPGGYFAEREYSNAWNRIVFNGMNVRLSIDSSVNTMNRELRRKMEEFGYMKNGKVVKPYKVPTLADVERWLSEDAGN